MSAPSPLTAFDELTEHPKLGELASIAHGVARAMASGRRTEPAPEAKAKAEEAGLSADDAKTSFGDAVAVLERGPEDDAERALACALWAHAIAEHRPKATEDEDSLARDILWLAAFTPFDVTPLLDRALGDDAGELWTAIAAEVKKIDARQSPHARRAEAIVGAAAIALSTSKDAPKLLAQIAREAADPMLKKIATPGGASSQNETHFSAQIAPVPRGPVATTALALTGLLLVVNAAGLVARHALALDRPAEVRLRGSEVEIESRTILLGRTLGEKKTVIPKDGLARAAREVRYPRAAFYAGLLSLAVGSYFGVSMLVDGTRSASPPLLLGGLLVVAAGIALDFVLRSIEPSARGKCRVVFVPKKGAAISVYASDTKTADQALAALAKA